jgi:hypothetical protein
MDDNMQLTKQLEEMTKAIAARDRAVANARDLIVEFAVELERILQDVPADIVGAAALDVRVSVRGRAPNTPEDLTIEELPPVDEDGFEARPGAISVYLDALGQGTDRVYFEIRSNPGTLVCAIVGANDPNTRSSRLFEIQSKWFESVCGITRHDGRPVLVRYDNENGDVAIACDAAQYFSIFLKYVERVTDTRARFNKGDEIS